MILTVALAFASACFSLALALNLLRLITAATPADRVLAVDTMTVNAIALLALYGATWPLAMTFEPALLFAMTGFVSTLGAAKYLLRGSIVE